MGNNRHIFKFACSEKLLFSGNSKNPEKIKGVKKVKLVSEDNTKEIEFHGSYFGSYYIFKPDRESNEKFQLFVYRTKNNDTGEEVYLFDPIDLASIRVKVTLDNQCRYQVALSFSNNEWITLPRSSLLYTNYDDLKKYYNKDLKLSHSNLDNRVPSIMYGQEKVCELTLISAPICLDDNNNIRITAVTLENGIRTDYLNDSRLVIEKDENNQLLIYLSDRGRNHIDTLGRHVNKIHNYFNIILRSALLENSNIREVLPELEIDDNVNLDTRQLKCWINNTSTIQKITDESFKDSVKDLLKSDPEFINSVKGERGPQGPVGKDGKREPQEPRGDKGDNNAQQNFTLQKGEKLLDDVYEANIISNNKTMATLPKIGYYMLNNQLVVRNHVTKEEVAIPRDFHYLKVVKFGSGFSSGDYKLTFCNVLGNEFFEYKKYDPQYSNVSDEYKFISLNCTKKEYNPNLNELFSHRPSFFITEGPAEPDSDKYSAAVFELTHNGKGKKMATLIDEFGYFDQNGTFIALFIIVRNNQRNAESTA